MRADGGRSVGYAVTMTSELPERRGFAGQPPETRASDAEREQIAERLREAMAEGRLDMEEFDERLGRAYEARTHGELVPLVRDLPDPSGAAGPISLRKAEGGGAEADDWSDRVGGTATSTHAVACFGGFSRKGKWTVGRAFSAVTVLGGGEIDLREARFEDRVTVIRCFSFMGGVQVTVPPDVDLEVRGFAFMGGFAESPTNDDAVADISASPHAPKVIVSGFALLGGVGVERKLRKEERRRLKEERKRQALESGGRDDYRDGEGYDGLREQARERRDRMREQREERLDRMEQRRRKRHDRHRHDRHRRRDDWD